MGTIEKGFSLLLLFQSNCTTIGSMACDLSANALSNICIEIIFDCQPVRSKQNVNFPWFAMRSDIFFLFQKYEEKKGAANRMSKKKTISKSYVWIWTIEIEKWRNISISNSSSNESEKLVRRKMENSLLFFGFATISSNINSNPEPSLYPDFNCRLFCASGQENCNWTKWLWTQPGVI